MIDPSRRQLIGAGAAAIGAVGLGTGSGSGAAERLPRDPFSLFAVAFEVLTHPHTRGDYLDTAKALRPILEDIDGFREIDRWTRRSRPGWLLSLSFWEDEAALTRWRSQEKHHLAQVQGRSRIFADYRIRVAQVIADAPFDGAVRTPERRSAYRSASLAHPKLMTFLETDGDDLPRVSPPSGRGEVLDSNYLPGKVLRVDEHDDAAALAAWEHRLRDRMSADGRSPNGRWRTVEVERDYRLRMRDEAPQFMPAV